MTRSCTFKRVAHVLGLMVWSASGWAQTVIHIPGDTASLASAISQVPNGGVIEIATGTYTAPSGGWQLGNLGKSFTIRAAVGSSVTLSGGGTTRIFNFINGSLGSGGQVVFRNLTFADGYSASESFAGGLTLFYARATFVGCTFQNNYANVNTTVGGALHLAFSSEVVFTGCTWVGNRSKVGGAGLGIRDGCTVHVHGSQFLNNMANPPNHNPWSGGGGINVGNASLSVTHTAFVGNSATYGAGLYAIGNWQEPTNVPRTDVVVANCWFEGNRAERDPSVTGSYSPTEGGAVNAEDQTRLRIYSSRFTANQAEIGGGVNVYRAQVEVRGCTFMGNRAVDPDPYSGFGGAIKATSDDGPGDGTNNRPAARLVVEDTLVQGRYQSITTVAQTGGCIYTAGDGARMDGDPTVPDLGTIADNQAQVTLRRVLVHDCDVATSTTSMSAFGGGVASALSNLLLDDCLVINNDAFGAGTHGAGGGMAVWENTTATIQDSTFVRNTALLLAGGVFGQGSELAISGCQLAENEVSPGVAEPETESYGAAILATVDTIRSLDARGVVASSTFSRNIGLPIWDDDLNTAPTVPINDTRYNQNQFYTTLYAGKVYRDNLVPSQTPSDLNALVVVRGNGLPSTDKSQVDNTALGSAPNLGGLIAAPPLVLYTAAPGEPVPTAAYAGWGWSGSGASLDGSTLTANAGITQVGTGSHDLQVGGIHVYASTTAAAVPAVTFSASPSVILPGGTSTLTWNVPSGTFLLGAIDHGIGPVAQTGSIQVTPSANRTYRFMAVTAEGGATQEVTVTIWTASIFADGFESGGTTHWSTTQP